MGGHAAWRKRIAAGEPAKGRGGAIARHRPHLGRKGEDLKLNRKGNIAGGNPKKSKSTKAQTTEESTGNVSDWKKRSTELFLRQIIMIVILVVFFVSTSAALYRHFLGKQVR